MVKILALLATVRAFVAPAVAVASAAVAVVRQDPAIRLVILFVTTLGLVALARVLPFWPYAPIGTAAIVLLNRVLEA